MSKCVLQAQGLGRRFHEGVIDVTVLHEVDVQVHAGETLAVVGTSGSGKSTLLHLLGGLDTPTTGSVRLLDRPLAGLDATALGQLRNQHLGFGAVLGSSISGYLIDTYFTSAGVKDWQTIWISFSIYALIIAIAFAFLFKHKHDPAEVENVSH